MAPVGTLEMGLGRVSVHSVGEISLFTQTPRVLSKGNRTIADLRYGKKTVSVLAHFFLLPYRANLVYILSISHLRYCKS